jgi:hypothetical protein
MLAVHKTIVRAYEELHLSLEEIAEEHEVSITEIKMMLLQYSSKYRNDIKECSSKDTSNKLDFDDDEQLQAKEVIKRVMIETEDEHLKLRAALYVRDDGKGRKDVDKNLQKIGVRLFEFNAHFQNVLSQQRGESLKKLEKKVVDI